MMFFKGSSIPPLLPEQSIDSHYVVLVYCYAAFSLIVTPRTAVEDDAESRLKNVILIYTTIMYGKLIIDIVGL